MDILTHKELYTIIDLCIDNYGTKILFSYDEDIQYILYIYNDISEPEIIKLGKTYIEIINTLKNKSRIKKLKRII